MKSNRAVQSSVDISNLTVPDAEEIIEEALSELAFSQDPGLARALRFLAPPGYQAIVELCGENGRLKKMRSASTLNVSTTMPLDRCGKVEPGHLSTRALRKRSKLTPQSRLTLTRGLRNSAQHWLRQNVVVTHSLL